MQLSEKLTRILRAKFTLTPLEISEMTEAEGWALVYSNVARPGSRTRKQLEICFTGFSADEKEKLMAIAVAKQIKPVGNVTKNLLMLVAGENAGPAKLQKAREQDTPIVTFNQFLEFIETGVVP